MKIDIGNQPGTTYCLDLKEQSVNCIRSTLEVLDFLPVPDYNYGYYYAGKNHFTDRDIRTDMYQIFLTHSGRGKLYLGTSEYDLTPNTVAFMSLQGRHRYETVGDSWEYEWVNFNGPCCDYYNGIINADGFTVYDLRDNTEIGDLMTKIRTLAMSVGESMYVQTGTTILCLLDAIRNHISVCQLNGANLKYQESLNNVVQYMNSHYMDKLTLDDLAGIAFLSKFYFTRAFTSYTGLTPYKYLNTLRITHARRLLVSTSLSIEEISWKVGFGNSKNLDRAFKLATDYTPQEYRSKGPRTI